MQFHRLNFPTEYSTEIGLPVPVDLAVSSPGRAIVSDFVFEIPNPLPSLAWQLRFEAILTTS